MERWANKVAVVTGASSGIGNAIAKELVKHGMKVAALARRVDRLEELEKEVNKVGKIKGIKCDISKEDEIKTAINWIETNWGDIHVLVNNAGIARIGSLTGGTEEPMPEVFETNVTGVLKCTREVVKLMKKRQIIEGHIININTAFTHFTSYIPNMYPYVASKHALNVITHLLKTELAMEKSSIRVTAISPGFVETEATQPLLNLGLPAMKSTDISNCVVFALSTSPNVNVTELIVEPVGELLTEFKFPNDLHQQEHGHHSKKV